MKINTKYQYIVDSDDLVSLRVALAYMANECQVLANKYNKEEEKDLREVYQRIVDRCRKVEENTKYEKLPLREDPREST